MYKQGQSLVVECLHKRDVKLVECLEELPHLYMGNANGIPGGKSISYHGWANCSKCCTLPQPEQDAYLINLTDTWPKSSELYNLILQMGITDGTAMYLDQH